MSKVLLIMDEPKNCFDCDLENWLSCNIMKRTHVGDNRPNWCPLIKINDFSNIVIIEYDKLKNVLKDYLSDRLIEEMIDNMNDNDVFLAEMN